LLLRKTTVSDYNWWVKMVQVQSWVCTLA